MEKKALAIRAGVGQSTISQLESAVRKPSTELVRRIVLGLVEDKTDEHTVNALIDEGLIAAGFAPEGDTYRIVRFTDDITATDVPATAYDIIDSIADEDLPRALERIAQRLNKPAPSSPELEAAKLASAERQTKMTYSELEAEDRENERRAKEGRKR